MNEPSAISVMIVDDHFVVRSGLVSSLEFAEDVSVIAEAESGEEGLERFVEHRPQVVLMDLQLPGWNGIETTEKLLDEDPNGRVLMFSTFAREDEVQASLDGGAAGYLLKSAGREELIRAIRTVASGDRYLPGDWAETLAQRKQDPVITRREREILEWVAAGKANKEIGVELGITEDTVKRHVSNVLQKLGVSDRAQATAEAIRRGILRV
ncbi:MAG: response regulator transcription factor [Verrucomicrobiota bacterium]